MKQFFILVTVVFSACNTGHDKATVPASDTTCSKYLLLEEIGKRIKFEEQQSSNFLYAEYNGNYNQHPTAIPELMGYAFKNYKPAGPCIGLYPQDPDATPENELHWQVGIRVTPMEKTSSQKGSDDPFAINVATEELTIPLEKLKAPGEPYKLKVLPSVQVISVVTTVGKAAQDGLAMNAWLIINGYVQTATTRMQFAMVQNKDPMSTPVKISIPVTKRKTGLSLITK